MWISIKFLLKFVSKGPITNTPTMVQILAWRRPGDNQYLNQWCLVYWRIYASLCLNELMPPHSTKHCNICDKIYCPWRNICLKCHDDVIKWKYFPRKCPFVRGIHRSPVNSSHKGQWRGALMFSLICVWINDWVNNREAGDSGRYRAHYDVIVIVFHEFRGVEYMIVMKSGYNWMRSSLQSLEASPLHTWENVLFQLTWFRFFDCCFLRDGSHM